MAAGAPVVATERLRHPRAGRARGQRPAGRARRPAGARRRAACACTTIPSSPRRLTDERPRDRAASASTASASRSDLAALFAGGDRDEHAVAPAPRALRQRARAPRPRARRRASPPAASRFAGETRDARPRARLARPPTCPRTRSGGSTGSSSTTGSTSPTPSAPPATRATCDAWERLVASFIVAGPAGPRRQRGHRPPDPQLDLRVAAAARGATIGDALAESLARRRRATCARHLTPERNHRTLELYALLIAALALPDDRPACGLRRRASCTRTCWPTSAPTACTASAARTTT